MTCAAGKRASSGSIQQVNSGTQDNRSKGQAAKQRKGIAAIP